MTTLVSFIDWLESKELPCFYKSVFHIECPGCGMQRAFIALLRGHLGESIRLYPPLLPILLMFALLTMHLVHPFKHGAKILKYLFIFNVALILFNYLYKIIF